MNSMQRIGVNVALAIVLVLVFLHSPWSGYEIDSYSEVLGSSADLPFSLWRTSAPLVNWLGFVQNLVASIVLIVLLTALWVAANKSSKK